ncbi:TRAP transporter substrate-binding protein [Plasticicumulans sp.]|uniref:TRAP transporter substrate-binding protein n=1 Tax=Plasticicumulans sp. TaxID=2307179 RepID=UPI0039647A65
MNIPRIARLLAVAWLAAMPVLPFTASADVKPRLIRFGYGLAEDSNQGRAARFFAEEVGRLSGGRLRVRTFGGASLGTDIQMQNALIGGAQEMMVGSTATLVGIVRDFGVFDLPFLFDDERIADAVLDGPFGTRLLDTLPAQGLIGLVYWENGFRSVTNTRRPIERLEDLHGLKLRVMQNPVYLDFFGRTGANPVPLPFSELFTALETRAVDGQENPVNTIRSSRFYEVQKYLSLTRHVYSPWILLVSRLWWDKLSEDERALLREAAVAARDFERRDSRAEAGQALAQLQAQGMLVNTPSTAELERLRAAVAPVVEAWAAQASPGLVAQLRQAIDAARAAQEPQAAQGTRP